MIYLLLVGLTAIWILFVFLTLRLFGRNNPSSR